MSFEIEERDREGIAILVCKGKLVTGSSTDDFHERTRAVMKDGKNNLILNMEQVDHIDSSGLGELLSLEREIEGAGGKLKLVEVNEKNVDLLVITKLETEFELFPDEQEAVNSFFPDRQISTFDLLEFVQDIKEDKK